MKHHLILMVMLCGLLTSAAAQQKQPTEAETLRINTALVTLSVGVTDKQGRPLTNLQQADFALYEDGKFQELEFFGAEDQPISFGLLLDRSQSMNEAGKLTNAIDAALTFLRAGNPQNEAFCLAFNDSNGLLSDFTSNYPQIAEQLSRLTGAGGTALYDAILAGLDKLADAKHRRRALIVITDGRDEHSQHKLAELIQRAQQTDAQIYTIGFYSTVEAEIYREEKPFITMMDGTQVDNPRVVFKALAAETGAETFFPKNAAELSTTIARIAASLRRQYTLAYYPAKQESDDRYRRIEVKIRNVGKDQIKTRQGYRLSEPLARTASPSSNIKADSATPATTSVFTLATREVAEAPVPQLFRENFDQPSSHWPQTEKTYAKKGKYYVHGEAVIPLPPIPYKDFELTVTAALLGDATTPGTIGATELSAIGLSFRINPNGYYELSLAPIPGKRMGIFTLSKVANGQNTILRRADKEPLIGISNQIKIRCQGTQIELFINGLRVAALNDSSHQKGTISLLFNGNGVTFDDLTVKRLD